MANRLPEAPGQAIDRSKRVTFTFDGKRYSAYEGDTIGSALHAGGLITISRSFKYHRPRGLLCSAGRCPNCLVNVDGAPNVRACTELVRQGMKVRSQNAWPSLKYDAMSIGDRFDFLLPVGFYYKTFIRPRRAWPIYEKVLRRAAGLGTIDINARPRGDFRKRHLHCDVAVVGGGPAGCMAALAAAGAGASVILVDDQPSLGGHLRITSAPLPGAGELEGLAGFEAAAKLNEFVSAQPNIETVSGATAFGIYEGRLVAAMQGDLMVRIRAEQVVIATGAAERPALFANNDLPGVMLASGAVRLARLYGVRPGARTIVYTDDDHGWLAAAELLAAGVGVTALVDRRAGAKPSVADALRQAGVELITGVAIASANGRGYVSGVTLEGATPREIECDLLAVASRLEPVIALLAQDGSKPAYDAALGEFVPGEPTPAVRSAGDVRGFRDPALALEDGSLAGLEAAAALGRPVESPAAGRAAWQARWDAAKAARAVAPDRRPSYAKKQFVCVCEDVTTKDISNAIAEGFDSLETLKRYSTVTMGPCQGKMCHGMSARLHAILTKQTPAETGLTTARPPFQPVQLGTLAGPHLSPVRRTAMHSRHAAFNPKWMDMGEWKRPLVYSTIDAETRAVHEAAGLIDVSTLGKLDVRGKDAAPFLDWLHPNRFSDLKIGRVRYRAMLDDAGIILDDGTVARLAGDRFLVSTTTGNIDAIDQWLKWWLAGSNSDVQVVNVTSEFAAVNLAGPNARDILAKLTDLDVSKEGMPYLAAAQGAVAGVATVILRIGFVGELGYEMHFPADYAEFMWDAIMDAGKEFGIRPFGVEAQRVLRLEKQHAIVGQDTDALSQPYEAGMGWLVKDEKPDFIGKDALAVYAQEGEQQRLVGFEIPGHNVPNEGEAIVKAGEPVGRVTSAKWSPYLLKTIGLGWVPLEDAEDGRTITIRKDGAPVEATIRTKPFYDPEGARLRS